MKTTKFLFILICYLCISLTSGNTYRLRKRKRIPITRGPIVRVESPYKVHGRSAITETDYSQFSNDSPLIFGRMYSSNNIQPEQAPYVVAIFDSNQQIGVGAIVRAQNGNIVILTSGECVANDPSHPNPNDQRDTSKMAVHFGLLDRDNPEGQDYTQVRKVASIKRPDEWRRPTYNDIAIIFLEENFEPNRYAQPIPLPPQPEIYPPTYPPNGYNESLIYATGWNKKLVQTILTAVDIDECKKIYADNYKEDIITEMNLCAIDRNKEDDGALGPCIGGEDKYYGAPAAAIDMETDEFYLAGVFSFRGPGKTYECGPNEFPVIYTKVSQYLDWIEQNSLPPDQDSISARMSELIRPELKWKPKERFSRYY